jgi:hypothetical protein
VKASETQFMANPDFVHHRLSNQRIAAKPFERPEEVVRWLGAVQAQDYAGAKWALGLRIRAATDDDVSHAFAKGAILRTHLLRPTWHFVTPEDIRWLLALTAPRVHAANDYMYRKLELDNDIFKRSNAALKKALRGGQQLTRDELRSSLLKAGITTDESLRMVYILMYAELEGIICSGERRGKQFTYALLDERVPPTKTLTREEGLAELTRRYFLSRGPATVKDFAKWSGLTVADAKEGVAAVKNLFEHTEVQDRTYWFSATPATVTDSSPRAYLLSIYDEYISGYQDRSAMVTAEVGARLVALDNASSYIVVINGQVVGSCRRTFQKKSVVIETDIFTELTRAEQQAVTEAAHRYGAFFGMSVVLA